MQIRIESSVEPAAITAFLKERKLRVPVFFDPKLGEVNTHIVVIVNRRSRLAAFELITWLLTR